MSPMIQIRQRESKEAVRWEILALEKEVSQLRREREHLSSKAHERPLTIWEQTRLNDTIREIINTARQLASLRRRCPCQPTQ